MPLALFLGDQHVFSITEYRFSSVLWPLALRETDYAGIINYVKRNSVLGT